MATGGQQAAKQAARELSIEEQSEFDRLMAQSVRTVSYVPFGETESLELKYGQVLSFISGRTKSGKRPGEADVIKFMMLCKARALNPWVGDAYLVGYDGKDGPEWSLITSINALMKRAEANPAYNGMESGVVVVDADGKLVERQGDLVLAGEKLVGGWAKCYRKDRAVCAYDALDVRTYDKGFAMWAKDKPGMIAKCAEASVLRKSFPSQLSGLYISQEMAERVYVQAAPASAGDGASASTVSAAPVPKKVTMDDLTGAKQPPAKATPEAPATQPAQSAAKPEPQAQSQPQRTQAKRPAAKAETPAAKAETQPPAKTAAKPAPPPAPDPEPEPQLPPVVTAYDEWRSKIESASTEDEARAALSDASGDENVTGDEWDDLSNLVATRWDVGGDPDEIPFG